MQLFLHDDELFGTPTPGAYAARPNNLAKSSKTARKIPPQKLKFKLTIQNAYAKICELRSFRG